MCYSLFLEHHLLDISACTQCKIKSHLPLQCDGIHNLHRTICTYRTTCTCLYWISSGHQALSANGLRHMHINFEVSKECTLYKAHYLKALVKRVSGDIHWHPLFSHSSRAFSNHFKTVQRDYFSY